MSQFLIAVESSIVGTSIVSIANDLGSWERAQLVFTMYLVCYASTNSFPSSTIALTTLCRFHIVYREIIRHLRATNFLPRILVYLHNILHCMRCIADHDSTVCIPATNPYIAISNITLNNPMSSVIFRSFQGLGAGGIQAISIVVIPNLIPLPKVLNYSSAVAMTLIFGLIIGLFLGGWISSQGAWRWIFYIK